MEIINKMIGFYKKAILENYFNFNGRAAVGEYWWFVLTNFLISLVITIVAATIKFPLLDTVYSLAVLLPSLGVAVRRLHDIGKSGWWVLAPLYNIYLLIQKSEPNKNAFGEPTK